MSSHEAIWAAVVEAHESGVCVVPPAQDGSKRPIRSWKRYQQELPSLETLERWYRDRLTGIGFVAGEVSGRLEMIDFDDRSVYNEFKKAATAVGLGDLVERIESGYLEYSPNGVHWPYRCEEIAGNTKLAQKVISKKERKSIIETRGEGGFVIVAPSFGSVNKSGTYRMMGGAIATIATITPEERKQLHDLARTFDESPIQEARTPRQYVGGDETRPGDDYNQRATWEELLEPHGWVKVYTQLGVAKWRRPGKKHGISATTNVNDSDLFYVFSTSTEFDAERGYDKFGVYALLEHHGDHATAARELALLGYGGETPDTGVDLSGIMAKFEARKKAKEPDTFPAELLKVPGMVGELAEYINTTSTREQPILALGAAIAAVATVIGRKVCTETRLRPNVYVLGVAETGAGKERARKAIRTVFERIGAGQRVAYDEMASDAAIITAVRASPSCLFLLDEIGRTLKEVANPRAQMYVKNQASIYLKLYSGSDGVYYSKNYADAEKSFSIEQPSLSIYGTTVPKMLWDSMSSDQVSDGWLSRFLIFESEDRDPEHRDITDLEPKISLLEQFDRWEHDRRHNENPNAGNIAQVIRPDPMIVGMTQDGRTIFNDMESQMRAVRADLMKQNKEFGMYTRVTASARKLALIRACGRNFDRPEITESDAAWAAKLCLHLVAKNVKQIDRNVSDSVCEEVVKKMADIIRCAGKKGIAKGKLTDKLWRVPRKDRDDALITLRESERVKVVLTRVHKSKKMTLFWVGD